MKLMVEIVFLLLTKYIILHSSYTFRAVRAQKTKDVQYGPYT